MYYLNVTYYLEGHSIPENAKFTLNGKEPAGKLEVSQKNGITVVRLAYEFKFGTPKEYEVMFEGEIVDDPVSLMLPLGTKLKFVAPPVLEDVEGYVFGGWYVSYDHIDWDDAVVTEEDLFAYPNWIKLIDKVNITFQVPAVGQVWKMPQAPKNAPYHIEEVKVRNKDYRQINKILKKEKLSIEFKVALNSARYAFAMENDRLMGELSVKGANVDYTYFDSDNNLFVQCEFTPKDNKVTALMKGGDYKIADKVIRSSKSNKSFAGSAKSPLKLRAGKKTKKSIKLSWKRAKGAKKYVVYGALKGKKMVKIKTLTKRSFTVKKAGKKLSKGKTYKFLVVAVGKNNLVVSTSKTVTGKK